MSTMKDFFNVDELSFALRAHLKVLDYPTSTTFATTTTSTNTPSKTTLETARSLDPPPPTTTNTTTITTKKSKKEKVTSASSPVAPLAQLYDRWKLLDDSSLDYGYLKKTGGCSDRKEAPSSCSSSTSSSSQLSLPVPFYITTAINYTNGPAHMGHAYEASTADVIARYNRMIGGSDTGVYFVTGSDEHGQKIAAAAAEQQKEPIEICDHYVMGFQVLNQRMRITNDDYIRTTSERHKRTAHALWLKCASAGDIYLDVYSGWYNVREETFVTDNEALLMDYKDPTTGLPLKQVQEESYFFRMSKYQQRLIDHIENVNPKFIQPDMHRNLILQRLKSDELRDLSISRTTFTWGISVPDGFKTNHVMYVWVDALSNYLTGVDALQTETTCKEGCSSNLHMFWPASVHIIGKDILWFHTVIWPCLLMSANITLPLQVFAHGFVNDKDGKKMSKSIGNVVDPHDMLDKFHVDTFRWYLCKEAPYGGELAFSEDSMRDMHNADLCDNFGNVVHRAATLCQNDCDGVVPDVPAPTPTTRVPLPDFKSIVELYCSKMNKFELQSGANIAIQAFRDINGYLQNEEPWKKKGPEFATERQIINRCCLEAIYAATHLLLPFLPEGASKVFQKLGTEPVASLSELSFDCRNLKPGTKITVGDVLYTKALSDEERIKLQGGGSSGGAGKGKKESHAEAQQRKKESKEKAIAASKVGLAASKVDTEGDDPNQPDFVKIDFRVGRIVKVWNHPEADKLFCEQIDVGDTETGPRDIASGLRDHYTLEQMQDRLVVVVCNLKPAKIVGFTSNGMVLAAKAGGCVELIDPPPGSTVGERISLEQLDALAYQPATSTQVKKKKIWESVATNLVTAEEGIATWSGMALITKAGPCKAASLVGAPIS